MGWEVGGRFETEGISVCVWLIHIDVWQKPTEHCKAIILQLKINNFFKKGGEVFGGALVQLADGWGEA